MIDEDYPVVSEGGARMRQRQGKKTTTEDQRWRAINRLVVGRGRMAIQC